MEFKKKRVIFRANRVDMLYASLISAAQSLKNLEEIDEVVSGVESEMAKGAKSLSGGRKSLKAAVLTLEIIKLTSSLKNIADIIEFFENAKMDDKNMHTALIEVSRIAFDEVNKVLNEYQRALEECAA